MNKNEMAEKLSEQNRLMTEFLFCFMKHITKHSILIGSSALHLISKIEHIKGIYDNMIFNTDDGIRQCLDIDILIPGYMYSDIIKRLKLYCNIISIHAIKNKYSVATPDTFHVSNVVCEFYTKKDLFSNSSLEQLHFAVEQPWNISIDFILANSTGLLSTADSMLQLTDSRSIGITSKLEVIRIGYFIKSVDYSVFRREIPLNLLLSIVKDNAYRYSSKYKVLRSGLHFIDEKAYEFYENEHSVRFGTIYRIILGHIGKQRTPISLKSINYSSELTQEQLKDKFGYDFQLPLEDERCSICLDSKTIPNIKLTYNRCGHSFHTGCFACILANRLLFLLKLSLSRTSNIETDDIPNSSCPECRHEIFPSKIPEGKFVYENPQTIPWLHNSKSPILPADFVYSNTLFELTSDE